MRSLNVSRLFRSSFLGVQAVRAMVSGRGWSSARGVRLGVEPLEDRTTPTRVSLVKDILAGAGASNPRDFVNVNGTLFFTARDGTTGRELWKSNGTAAGTVLVKNIRPGSDSSYPSSLINVNGTLFFAADDGTMGFELWKLT
jgi:ELWxxDGT repeat protein